MATKAALLTAAKRIVAAAAKTTKPKRNPAPRIGTEKPLRVSQITKAKPSKRLVARRKANTAEGYFPNPGEISAAYKAAKVNASHPYCVERMRAAGKWDSIGSFALKTDAINYANALGKTTLQAIRVVKY